MDNKEEWVMVPVGMLEDWYERINTIAAETAFSVADEMVAMLAEAPVVQGEPVGTTSIAHMCQILKEHYIEKVKHTDCTILYTVTFEQLRAIYDRGRKEAPRPAEPDNERLAMEAVMESVDPATWPGLTPTQRCALGRFAKPQPTEQQSSQDVVGLPLPMLLEKIEAMRLVGEEENRHGNYAVYWNNAIMACLDVVNQVHKKQEEGK